MCVDTLFYSKMYYVCKRKAGEAALQNCFFSLLKRGLLEMGGVCPPPRGSKFFSFLLDLFFGLSKQESNQEKISHKSCLPCKNGEKKHINQVYPAL